jgi:hypothetical protein
MVMLRTLIENDPNLLSHERCLFLLRQNQCTEDQPSAYPALLLLLSSFIFCDGIVVEATFRLFWKRFLAVRSKLFSQNIFKFWQDLAGFGAYELDC